MEDSVIDVEAVLTQKPMAKSNLPKALTLEEKKYLLAVERGDMPNVRRILQKGHRHSHIDIDCVDSLGRGALTLAIDGENLEMVELLVIMRVKTKDALLHAINAEFVEAVELLLEHEELIHKEGEPYNIFLDFCHLKPISLYNLFREETECEESPPDFSTKRFFRLYMSWQTVDINAASFTPDITPLILAAHRNNYEILKILLDRGATIPMPHDIKCGCDDCIRESQEDYLRHSLSRLNAYRALASPSLIALSSSDPLLTAFQLSWELRNLAFTEQECKSEYLELRKQCQQFAVDLLHESRSSQELAIILNYDPDSPPYKEGDHMKLARLELAITYKQKKFVAHPNIQQLLSAMWYEGVPGFKRKSISQKLVIIVKTAVLFPIYCTLYMLAPQTSTGKLMRKPFMKFLIHASSYLFFLFLLILVSQRAEDQLIELFGTESMKTERFIKQRGNPPAILEYVVILYVVGFIYEETYEIYVEGVQSYMRNLWNFIDFTRNFLYFLVFLLRVAAYLQQMNEISKDPSTAYIPRERWNAFDPQLIAEGLFAAANIFSALKLVHLFSINPHLGPLQISLGRMVIDIIKFFFIYSLVLFAFACGLNQLLWYFSDLERKRCYVLPNGEPDWEHQADSCMKWRSFANVFESSQSLFWASFGMVELGNFELTGIKSYTRFWGLLMFGSYSVINVIVLLNLLIAMMSNSYAMIDEHSDTEWKFARTKLWMSYFEEGDTLPPPFNIFPTLKTVLKMFKLRKVDKLRRMSTKRRNKEEKERDYRYTSVMRALVWRYIATMHKKCEEDLVTEDDINEVKGDISAFRYDILEVLNKNGMDISSVEKREKAVLGKKMKIWERRLMKDFKVAPVVTDEEADQLIYEPPPDNEDALSKFRRVAKLAALNSNLNKWGQVVKGACLASQIGHCSNKDSYKKQQNLLKAMEEAQRFVARSPLPASRSSTPIELPDTTGQSIIEILKDIEEPVSNCTASTTVKVLSSMKNPLQPNVLINQKPVIALSPSSPIKIVDKQQKIPLVTKPESDKKTESLPTTPPTAELDGNKETKDFISLDSCPGSPKLETVDPSACEAKDNASEVFSQKEENTLDAQVEKNGTNNSQSSEDVDSTVHDDGDKSQSHDQEIPEIQASTQTENKAKDEVKLIESEQLIDEIEVEQAIVERTPTLSTPAESEKDCVEDIASIVTSTEETVSPTSVKSKSRKGQAPAIPEIKTSEPSSSTTEQPDDRHIEIEYASSKQQHETEKSFPKSPMTARNITRVGDIHTRRQPKTGWL